MEDLLSLLVVVLSLVSLLNKNAKKQMQKNAAKKGFHDIPPISAPQAVPKQTAAAPAATMMPPRPEYKPVTPLEAMAAQAAMRSGEGADSLEGRTDHSAHISCEGHDPCHEDQLKPAQRPARIAVQDAMSAAYETEKTGLDLDFTGGELVKAVVMQEILTRPCDRRRRAT